MIEFNALIIWLSLVLLVISNSAVHQRKLFLNSFGVKIWNWSTGVGRYQTDPPGVQVLNWPSPRKTVQSEPLYLTKRGLTWSCVMEPLKWIILSPTRIILAISLVDQLHNVDFEQFRWISIIQNMTVLVDQFHSNWDISEWILKFRKVKIVCLQFYRDKIGSVWFEPGQLLLDRLHTDRNATLFQ